MEGGENADGQVHAAQHVAHGVTDAEGMAAGLTGNAHQAAAGLGDDVVAGTLGIGAVAAEARDSAVDDLVVDLLQHVVTHAQLVHNAGTVVLHHHVGLLDHLQKQLLALRRLQVQGNALLIAVDVGVVHAGAVFQRAEGAGIVALAGHLDLDDVGAEVRQHHGAVGASQNTGQIQNRDITQCFFHMRMLLHFKKLLPTQSFDAPMIAGFSPQGQTKRLRRDTACFLFQNVIFSFL